MLDTDDRNDDDRNGGPDDGPDGGPDDGMSLLFLGKDGLVERLAWSRSSGGRVFKKKKREEINSLTKNNKLMPSSSTDFNINSIKIKSHRGKSI